MTLAEAISKADELAANEYTPTQKTEWINTIDKKIFHSIINTHEGYELIQEPEYVTPGEGIEEQILLVPEPYSEVYVYYLLMKIYLYNSEYARYNNVAEIYNQAYVDFAAWYNSNNMPLSKELILKRVDSDVSISELNI